MTVAFNVLIVDDSSTSRAVILKSLELAKVPLGEVHQAENGLKALEALKANWIDIVFADINMPVMNGVELVRNIAADEALKGIPVVVISTEGSQTRIEELEAQGICAFLRKPFKPEKFREIVTQVLGSSDAN